MALTQLPQSPTISPTICACCREVSVSFGKQKILDRISCDLHKGETVHLVGPNGAGKSVFLDMLSGWTAPQQGSVLLNLGAGQMINPAALPPERIATLGLGRLWQDIKLPANLTLLESVLIATPGLLSQSPLFALAPLPRIRRQEREARERAMHCLAHFRLESRAQSKCGELSVGEMKRAAMARLLQMETNIWLLDEPLAGADDATVEAMIEDFRTLKHRHFTLLIVEHRGERISAIAGRTWLLQDGKLTIEDAN